MAVLVLASCSNPTPKQLIAQCTLDADRLYASSDPHRYEMVSAYVATCMQAKGYEEIFDTPNCAGNPDIDTDSRCYRRASN